MPALERDNNNPCPTDGSHHPHLFVCSDFDDDCWDDYDDGRGYMQYHELSCCECGQEWPCETKRSHVEERKSKHQS